jgi:ABC-type Fe3+-hydroxamate transport system substrate-binding protein
LDRPGAWSCAGGRAATGPVSGGARFGRHPGIGPTRGGYRRSPASSFPLTLRDDEGTSVAIPHAPARIVSLAPSITETLASLALAGTALQGIVAESAC